MHLYPHTHAFVTDRNLGLQAYNQISAYKSSHTRPFDCMQYTYNSLDKFVFSHTHTHAHARADKNKHTHNTHIHKLTHRPYTPHTVHTHAVNTYTHEHMHTHIPAQIKQTNTQTHIKSARIYTHVNTRAHTHARADKDTHAYTLMLTQS